MFHGTVRQLIINYVFEDLWLIYKCTCNEFNTNTHTRTRAFIHGRIGYATISNGIQRR